MRTSLKKAVKDIRIKFKDEWGMKKIEDNREGY